MIAHNLLTMGKAESDRHRETLSPAKATGRAHYRQPAADFLVESCGFVGSLQKLLGRLLKGTAASRLAQELGRHIEPVGRMELCFGTCRVGPSYC